MDEIIKGIRKIIGDYDYSTIRIFIAADEIYFEIYESQIPICIDKKEKRAYIDCTMLNENKITSDMLYELAEIVKLLDHNMGKLLEYVK